MGRVPHSSQGGAACPRSGVIPALPQVCISRVPKPITWHGLTARYHRHERHVLRELARAYPDEARVLHEMKARLGATIRADFDERRAA